jgi:hypothetical protein
VTSDDVVWWSSVDVEQRKERGGAGARDELKEAVRKVRNKRNVSLFALSFLLLPLIFLYFFSTKKIFYWPSPGMLDREAAPGSTQKTKLNHTRCKLK